MRGSAAMHEAPRGGRAPYALACNTSREACLSSGAIVAALLPRQQASSHFSPRGATNSDETTMSYLMPVGERKLRLTDGKTSLWIKTAVDSRDPPENNGNNNNNGGGAWGMGMGLAHAMTPKQSVHIDVYCKDSSAALDATLKQWEKEYNAHIDELLRRKLTVLRPEVRAALRGAWAHLRGVGIGKPPQASVWRPGRGRRTQNRPRPSFRLFHSAGQDVLG